MTTNLVMQTRRGFLGLAATLLMATGWPQNAAADRLAVAENHIGKLIDELREIDAMRSSLTSEKYRHLIALIMETYFDVEGITRFTAGRYWRVASKEQRDAYKKVFRGILLSEASNRFDQVLIFSFTPTKAQARGDKLILVTGIAKDNSGQIPDTEIIWRVAAQAGKPMKIIDLEIENISMLKTQQDENTALIKRNGGDFDALIQAMRTRLDKINSQSKN
jgi:phospholipid transport system substrate-binding protein